MPLLFSPCPTRSSYVTLVCKSRTWRLRLNHHHYYHPYIFVSIRSVLLYCRCLPTNLHRHSISASAFSLVYIYLFRRFIEFSSISSESNQKPIEDPTHLPTYIYLNSLSHSPTHPQNDKISCTNVKHHLIQLKETPEINPRIKKY